MLDYRRGINWLAGLLPSTVISLMFEFLKACLDILTDRKVGTKDKATVFQEMWCFVCLAVIFGLSVLESSF